MLVRREWFDAVSKGMVRCLEEGNGLMLGQGDDFMLDRRVWFNVRSKNWFFCGVSNR